MIAARGGAQAIAVACGLGLGALAPLAGGCKSERGPTVGAESTGPGAGAGAAATAETGAAAAAATGAGAGAGAGAATATGAATAAAAAANTSAAAGAATEPSAGDRPLGIPAGSGQLVLGVVDDWDDVTAELWRYERAGGAWHAVGQPFEAVIGVNGAAWGAGLHGDGAPAGARATGPIKREGDGKAPAGAFALTTTYGYGQAPPEGARAPYQGLTASWRCVDDGTSAHYNQVIDSANLERDWSSAEIMRRADQLYRYVVFVDHNPKKIAGAGSCIFLHVWRASPTLADGSTKAGVGTAGCTAMAKASIESLFAWLDPAASPVYVLLPRDRADELRTRLNIR